LKNVEALVVLFAWLWNFGMHYELEKSSMSLLCRIFNDKMIDLWSAKCSSFYHSKSGTENSGWLGL
jgi:hypothetical protein